MQGEGPPVHADPTSDVLVSDKRLRQRSLFLDPVR